MKHRLGFTSRKSPAFRGNRAFTLIELLVVIAIIAILAAILFPVFAQARAKARAAACLSNNKQMALGFMMYIQDYDEAFPHSDPLIANNWVGTPVMAAPDGRIFEGFVTWPLQIYPYIKNGGKVSVFTCPEDTNSSGKFNDDPTIVPPAHYPPGDGWAKALPSSYLPNTNITLGWNTAPATVGTINFPASTYLLGDGSTEHPVGFADEGDSDMGDASTGLYVSNLMNRSRLSKDCGSNRVVTDRIKLLPGTDPGPCARHNQGNNYIFTDGHVKWEQVRKTSSWFAKLGRSTDNPPPPAP